MNNPHIIAAGCAHIDRDEGNHTALARLFEYVDVRKPDVLIFNGDWGDPWKHKWKLILASETWKDLWVMCAKRKLLGLETAWVVGNHDWDAIPSYLSPVDMYRNKFECGGFTFMHGWQFDWTWNLIHPLAFFIAARWPRLMVPIYRTFIQKKFKTPKDQKRGDPFTGQYEWNQHVGLIHLRARKHAHESGRKLIIGHTHCDIPFDGLLGDCGDMTTDFTFIEIEDGEVEVLRIDLPSGDIKPVEYRR